MQPSLSTSAAEMVKRHEYSIFAAKSELGVLNDNQAISKGRNGWNVTTSLIILLHFNVLP